MLKESKTLWAAASLAGIIVVGVLLVPNRPRSSIAARQCCICNLQQIATATEAWAIAHGTNTNDAPTWADRNNYRLYSSPCSVAVFDKAGKFTEGYGPNYR